MRLNWPFNSDDEQFETGQNDNLQDKLLLTEPHQQLSHPAKIDLENLEQENGKEELLSVPKINLENESNSELETEKASSEKTSSTSSLKLLLNANDLLTSVNQEAQQMMQAGVKKIRQSLKAERVMVYGFNPDGSGKVLAESVDSRWSRAGSSFDYDYILSEGNCKSYYVVNDISTKNFARCLIEVLEALEAKAYIVVPIKYNGELLGLLGAYQNSAPRNWRKSELKLMLDCAARLGLPLQQTAFIRRSQFGERQREKAIKREKGLAQIIDQIRNAQEEEKIFQIATQEGRKFLEVDRLGIYRFEPDWSGKFIAESVATGWTKLIDTILVVQDTYLQETEGGRYKHGECFAVEDIYLVGHQPCHVQILEQFEARAYMLAPIFGANKQLWGLIGAYQNTGVRKWQADEMESLRQLGLQVGIAMEKLNYIQQLEAKAEQEKAINRISEQIRQSFNLNEIFETITQELRQFFQADRTLVYQFNPDWSGQFLAESVASGWNSLLIQQRNEGVSESDISKNPGCLLRKWKLGEMTDPDTYLQETQGGRYSQGEKITVVDDIYTQNFSGCYIQTLERYQAKAYIITPIFQGKRLWGLLAVYQNSSARKWQAGEIESLRQLGLQVSIAMERLNYIQKLEAKAEREKTINRLTEQIRQSLNLNEIFQTTTQELRHFLQADRTLVYQFNPDWSGQFVAESVAGGWNSLSIQQRNEGVSESDISNNPNCRLRQWKLGEITETDTYLRETQGGRFSQGEIITVVDDIYTQNFAACYIQALERYEARAYIIAPMFLNKKLWGLLAVYQNSGPRHWQQSEIELVIEITQQMSVAFKQAALLAQIQSNNQELARRSQRERSIIQLSSRLMSRFASIVQKNNSPKKIMQFATNELRQVLEADRVAIYRFASDWSGTFIVESLGNGWPKLVGTELAQVKDSYIQENSGGRYLRGESLKVSDIEQAEQNDFPTSLLLEEWKAKAYLLVPIFKGEQLWGLLGIYQNDRPREWVSSEQAILEQVATNLGVTLQVGEYFSQLRSQETQLSELAEQERTKRENLELGALRVLQALEPSFQGDLTVRAPISEDEIGTIADGYNTTIQSLRELVRQVQGTAARVSETSSANSESVTQLSQQAQTQVEELKKALQQLDLMVASAEEVATCANKVELQVEQANRTVQSGDSLMEKTVDEIMEIRHTVADTGKKIKRLGETFQKITKVVNLIENFATQTNLLALNAAIEATRAGEYGKGFAVVADEVRALAYQSANATTEISRLVNEIQTETNEVTEAMEVGIAQVVKGTNMVRETQQSLNAIVTSTQDIKKLVEEITQAAANQSQQSQILTKVMADVSEISNQTSEGAAEISQSFEKLQNTSRELQTSVRQFKVD